MAKQDNQPTPQDILGAAGALGLPQSSDPTVNEMQKGLLALQYEQLKEQIDEKNEAKRIRQEARKTVALNQERARQNQEVIQRLCPHQKPNGQPAIAGQKDHQHNYIFICAYCAKTFDQHTLPAHLRIPNERIGGPE